jgi:hypothetical protein
MGIPSGEPSFHPIAKFSSEKKLQNTQNWCNIKELNMVQKNLLPFKLYMRATLETKTKIWFCITTQDEQLLNLQENLQK